MQNCQKANAKPTKKQQASAAKNPNASAANIAAFQGLLSLDSVFQISNQDSMQASQVGRPFFIKIADKQSNDVRQILDSVFIAGYPPQEKLCKNVFELYQRHSDSNTDS